MGLKDGRGFVSSVRSVVEQTDTSREKASWSCPLREGEKRRERDVPFAKLR